MTVFNGSRGEVGFIDLRHADPRASRTGVPFPFTITLHLFSRTSSGYKYEGTRHADAEDAVSVSSMIAGITDFYVSLPLAELDFRILSMPFNDRKKIGKVLPFELDSLVSGGSGDIAFDSIVLHKSDGKYRVLAVYIKKTGLGAILGKLAGFGIDPRAVTSIELRAALTGNMESLPERLANPEVLSENNRLKFAQEELTSSSLNLRTEQFAYTGDIRKTGRAISVMMALVLLLLLVLHGDLWFRYFHSKAGLSAEKGQMRSIYARLFPDDRKIVDELYQMKSHMKGLKDRADIILGVTPLDLLLIISNEKAEGIVFNEIIVEKGLVTMKGEAGSAEAAGRLKESLSRQLPGLSLSDVKRSADGKSLFTLVAKGVE